MSTVDPLGTWQYAHNVCRPAGARLWSNRLGWATSTNGARWMPAAVDRQLSGRDLVERPSEVHGRRRRRHRVAPRHGIGQGVVELERGRSVAEPEVVLADPGGQTVTGDGHEVARSDVGEHDP